jgi:hypothetical protein
MTALLAGNAEDVTENDPRPISRTFETPLREP